MSWKSVLREIEAKRRRTERDALRRQKELLRLQKEQSKLNALEQAALEVDAFENAIEVLVSIHKEASSEVDWRGIASILTSPPPINSRRRAVMQMLELRGKPEAEWTPREHAALRDSIVEDEAEHRCAADEHAREGEFNCQIRSLARRVLEGDAQAYAEAMSEFSPLSELASLGSEISFTVHSKDLVECDLTVNGTDIIPKEAKSLTASGKLTVKAMAKARFHEIYQDYVCSCILRAAREILALLPVETVVATAKLTRTSLKTGQQEDVPVISIAAARSVMAKLDFQRIDPSDAMENFSRRGDAKASKRAGDFTPVKPLSVDDLATNANQGASLAELLFRVRELNASISTGPK